MIDKYLVYKNNTCLEFFKISLICKCYGPLIYYYMGGDSSKVMSTSLLTLHNWRITFPVIIGLV